MLHVTLKHRLLGRSGQIRQHINAHDTALVRERLHLAILLVAWMHIDSTATGMGNERSFRRRRDAFGDGLRVGMAEIKRNADFIHLRDGLAPKFGQPIRFAVETSHTEWAAVIVTKLHDSDAEAAKKLDPLDLAFQLVDGFKGI